MKTDIRHNLPDVAAWLVDTDKQTRFATSVAINRTANAVKDGLQQETRKVFDRPTTYIINSNRVRKYSNRQDLEAVIGPTYMGGKGVDPQIILAPQIEGGPRKLKASERALQRAGILPPGYFTVPGSAAPMDGYGNIKSGFVIQLLSYFQAFGEQGYKANTTAKRKAAMAKKGKGPAGYSRINGVEYFVAYGKLRGGRSAHLAPGIYSRTGTHGSDIKPVLMFVRRPLYKKRFDLQAVGQRIVSEVFATEFQKAWTQAMATARPSRVA